MKTITMQVPVIRTDEDLDAALARVEKLMDEDLEANTEEIRVLALVIEAYEDKHYPIDSPDPIEAIKFAMEQRGYTNRDLAELLGGRSRVSEIMNGKRNLSIEMIRKLHRLWKIPLESLVQETGEIKKRFSA
jgi:HTH-type transcriptional regulator/antitoxin HigA